ncbi:hypothetical protein K523DRAFT_325865 [Schizophyllum commune Tattone D]|nr:hypothetical protein K523DRAFT_325865 [Schizophyllum commune Tattone D]
MGAAPTAPDLTVSLELHLLDTLRPLRTRVPPPLAADLEPYLATPPPSTVPYALLLRISQWARAADLQSLGLNPSDYTMISLLAGTRTAPDAKLGKYVPPQSAEDAAAQGVRDRKAITALLNALLSIGGAAFAAWWAADKTGWRNEWRVLFALAVGAVVAISEAVLYIIWQSRATGKLKPLKLNTRRTARHKRIDAPNEGTDDTEPTGGQGQSADVQDAPSEGDLRKRITQKESAEDS